MRFAPGNRPIAAWPGASAIAEFQGEAGRSGERPTGAAQVDQVPGLVEEGGDDLGVAAQIGGQAGGDLSAVVEPPGPGSVGQ